ADRRNVLTDQQGANGHHPEAQDRQKAKRSADNKRDAQRPSHPPRLRPDQPSVGAPDTRRQRAKPALQVRIVVCGTIHLRSEKDERSRSQARRKIGISPFDEQTSPYPAVPRRRYEVSRDNRTMDITVGEATAS